MGRLIRSNDRWLRTLVGLPDQPSKTLAKTMAVMTQPSSPAARGGTGYDHMGLAGSDVREATTVLAYPLQQFRGVPVTRTGVPSGDLLASSAPGTSAPNASVGPVAWMDLRQVPGVRLG